ncbi:MAG: PDZ domain-containing protein [Phycisphaerae bacterium]|jgi:hypothetical protein
MNARTSLAALLLLAGSTFAQDGSSRSEVQLQGSFNQPLGSQRNLQLNRGISSQTQITKIVDGKQWSLTISDGDVRVEEDGRPVPADRIKRTGDSISVLDAGGKVVETFDVPAAGIPAMPNMPAIRPAPRLVEAPASHVMIGIMMEFDEAAGGLVVQHVFDDMPGANAGLKRGDVITEVGGKPVTGNEALRDAFKDRKPGDRIDLTVKDDAGQSRIRTIELAKYDQEALDKARSQVAPDALQGNDIFRDFPGFMQGFDDPALHERIRKSVEDAIESIKKSSAADAEKWKQSALDSLDKALATVEQHSGQWRRSLRGGSGSNSRALTFQGMPGRVFELPATPATPAPAAPGLSANHFEKLLDAMDRLNARLDALEKRLDDRPEKRQ